MRQVPIVSLELAADTYSATPNRKRLRPSPSKSGSPMNAGARSAA
jgi:hypothetical protein